MGAQDNIGCESVEERLGAGRRENYATVLNNWQLKKRGGRLGPQENREDVDPVGEANLHTLSTSWVGWVQ